MLVHMSVSVSDVSGVAGAQFSSKGSMIETHEATAASLSGHVATSAF